MNGLHQPQTCFGFKLIVQSDHPRMQLSEPVKQYLTPEQIADHNDWMLRFFGTTNMLKDGAYVIAEQAGFVTKNPRTYEQFRHSAVTHGVPGSPEARLEEARAAGRKAGREAFEAMRASGVLDATGVGLDGGPKHG